MNFTQPPLPIYTTFSLPSIYLSLSFLFLKISKNYLFLSPLLQSIRELVKHQAYQHILQLYSVLDRPACFLDSRFLSPSSSSISCTISSNGTRYSDIKPNSLSSGYSYIHFQPLFYFLQLFFEGPTQFYPTYI